MEGPTATAFVARASEANVATMESWLSIQPELERARQRLTTDATEAKVRASVVMFRRVVEPLVAATFDRTREVIQLVRTALRLDAFAPLDERTWQVALLALDQQRRLVESVCAPIRGLPRLVKKHRRIVAEMWPADLDRVYRDVLDAIDDVSETVALGLNREFRAELEREIATQTTA